MTKLRSPLSRLIIVTEHFSPSTGATAQLVTDLANHLSHIYPTIILTSTPDHQQSPSGYKTVRFKPFIPLSNSILAKSLSGLHFFFSTLSWLIFNSDNKSVILIVSNPPFVGLLGPILRLTKSLHYLFVFQDIFPRSATLTGVLPTKGPLTQFWFLCTKLVLNFSTASIVLNQAMHRRVQKDFSITPSKVITIENWAVEHADQSPKATNPLALKWNVDDVFTVQYSGNFGRLHDILTLLEASRLLINLPIHFLFVGDGPKKSQITKYTESFSLSNVSLHPYQSRSNLHLSLGACDVCVISVIPGAEDTVAPSKFYGIVASGKPVLYIGDHHSDIAKLISKYHCGIVVAPGEPHALAAALCSLHTDKSRIEKMGNQSRRLYGELFGLSRSALKYERIVQNIIESNG